MTRIVWMGIAVALVTRVSVPLHAQVPRDTRVVRIGIATLSGRVVNDDADARPVRHARVTCTAPELTAGLTAITDDEGRFTCGQLPAGRYTVSVTRDGWVATAYGASRPLRPGRPIAVAASQHADIVIRMMRGAVITGTLLDESEQPAVDTGVVAMRNVVQNGERRLVALGDYVVGATPPAGSTGASPLELRETSDLDLHHARTGTRGSPAPPQRRVAFAPTFFPGTSLASQAVTVTLRGGEERTGVDFAIQMVATARIEGAVSIPDGGPLPPGTQVTMIAGGQTAFPGVDVDGLRSARVPPDGSFSFSGVTPGVYTLLARATLPAVVWASTEIAVDGDSIAGLAMTLQPGLTIAGRLRFVGARLAPPADLAFARVKAEPVQAVGRASLAPDSVTVDREGRFVITGVTPGRYRLTASFPGTGRTGGWILRSATVGEQDTLDVPVAIQPGQNLSGATLTFVDRVARLTGTVRAQAGGAAPETTVVLFPADQTFWLPQSRRIQAVRLSDDGAYAIQGLPPGDYVLAAVEDVEPGEWFDPAFLQRLAPSGMRIAIAEGEQKVQDIRIGEGGIP
jgi:uncharacterized protein (DUF2141 family)